MTRNRMINLLLLIIAIIICVIAFELPGHSFVHPIGFNLHPPVPPTEAYNYSIYRTGVFEVAKVFGRSSGCDNADADLITETNEAAVKAGLDPRIAAQIIATESACNQYAISTRGAVGLMQINVSTWKNEFDFTDYNLLNRRDNIQVGTKILAKLIYTYGLTDGIHRYNGLGVGCNTCDAGYVQKILSEGRK